MAETSKRYAIRKLVRNEITGRLELVFVDTKTGEVVRDLKGYEVVGAGNQADAFAPASENSTTPTTEAESLSPEGVEGIDTSGSPGEKSSLVDYSPGKTPANEISFLANLTKDIPFLGDFFQAEAKRSSFPDAPAAPTATKEAPNSIPDSWANAAGKDIAFSTPPDTIGYPGSWADEAGQQVAATPPSFSGMPESWANQAGQQIAFSAPDIGQQTAGNQSPPSMQPAERGLGLAAIGPRDAFRSVSGASLAGLDEGTRNATSAVAANTPGGISINSGYRDPNRNTRVGGASKSSHMRGQAVDIDVSGMNEAQRRDAVERSIMAGFDRVGAYSGNTALHADRNKSFKDDDRSIGGVYGMFDRSNANMSRAPGWLTKGIDIDPNTPGAQSGLAPTPQARPTDMDKIASVETAQQQMKDPQSVARSVVENAVSPAEVAGLGFASRTKEERDRVAMALAGELGPSTLSALSANDFAAIDEAKNVMGVLENRAVSKNLSLLDVTTPGAVNAFMNAKLDTTEKNYKAYKETLNRVVDSFYSGKIGVPSAPKATHYANMSLVSPEWANYATNQAKVGQHTFYSGVLTKDRRAFEYNLPEMDISSFQTAGFDPNVGRQSNTPATGFGFVGPTDYSVDSSRSRGTLGSTTGNGNAPNAGGGRVSAPSAGWNGGFGSTGGNANAPNAGGGRTNSVSTSDAGSRPSSTSDNRSTASQSPGGFVDSGWGGKSGSTGGNANSPNAGGGRTSSPSSSPSSNTDRGDRSFGPQ